MKICRIIIGMFGEVDAPRLGRTSGQIQTVMR